MWSELDSSTALSGVMISYEMTAVSLPHNDTRLTGVCCIFILVSWDYVRFLFLNCSWPDRQVYNLTASGQSNFDLIVSVVNQLHMS